MKTFMIVLATCAVAQAQIGDIRQSRIRAHTQFLASDLLEGRGVGVRGGDLATEYLASQLAVAGVEPLGPNRSYFQPVPLVGVTTEPGAALSASAGGKSVTFQWGTEFVGSSQRQERASLFDAEVVFLGHGISAPEFQHTDYEGVDVKGKVVVLFTNEPPSERADFFGGRALTYYGRWTYKFEEANRRGAVACLIIHTTPTAGYGWEVVRNSWGREDSQVKLGAGEHALAFAGWLSREAGQKLLAMAGSTVDEMLKRADAPGFKPVPLSMRVSGKITSKLRDLNTRNVAGIVRGSDPKLASEAVIFSAHWDHLGIGTPVNGDAIYNGAIDNATGCGIVLELARAWAAQKNMPRRSAIFLFVTAEEGGLRGSEYYGRNPLVPAARTALNINFDALYPFGRTKDVVVTGAERTTVWQVVQDAAKRFQLEIKPDPRPEQGSYYRSDHFSLARVGIPAFSVKTGNEFYGKPAGAGDAIFAEFNSKHYHQPSDEYRPEWDFSGLEHLAQFAFTIATQVANQVEMPTWVEGDEFRKARDASAPR